MNIWSSSIIHKEISIQLVILPYHTFSTLVYHKRDSFLRQNNFTTLLNQQNFDKIITTSPFAKICEYLPMEFNVKVMIQIILQFCQNFVKLSLIFLHIFLQIHLFYTIIALHTLEYFARAFIKHLRVRWKKQLSKLIKLIDSSACLSILSQDFPS